MKITFSLEQLNEIAEKIVAQKPNKIILFHGEMGVGKTTLIKAIAKTLGVQDATSSPTFSLVNEYPIDNLLKIYHFDMYRLKTETEAYDMGIDEYLDSGNWCFIEWAEKIPNLIPKVHSSISINLLSDYKRELILKNES